MKCHTEFFQVAVQTNSTPRFPKEVQEEGLPMKKDASLNMYSKTLNWPVSYSSSAEAVAVSRKKKNIFIMNGRGMCWVAAS